MTPWYPRTVRGRQLTSRGDWSDWWALPVYRPSKLHGQEHAHCALQAVYKAGVFVWVHAPGIELCRVFACRGFTSQRGEWLMRGTPWGRPELLIAVARGQPTVGPWSLPLEALTFLAYGDATLAAVARDAVLEGRPEVVRRLLQPPGELALGA